MTAPKSTLRPRRRTSLESLPLTLADWFAGNRNGHIPWTALTWPDWALLPERWLLWKAAHPDARPPAGYEWLDDPNSSHHPPAWLLALARKPSGK